MTKQALVAAGRDVTAFVADWFEDLRSGGGEGRSFLGDLPGTPAGGMATTFLMVNIAKRAGSPDASEDEVLLYAVLAISHEIYRDDHGDDAHLFDWETKWEYIEESFRVVNEEGNEKNAIRLARASLRRMKTPEKWERELNERYWQDKEVGERAAHEREMAQIMERDSRAARLFNPEIDIDEMIMKMNLGNDSDEL